MVRGAEDAASKNGYFLITFNTDDRVERERQILSLLRSRRVDGILLVVAPDTGDGGHIKAVVDDGIPVVCLDRIPNTIDNLDSVSVNNVKGAQTCVQHLIMRGHRRIAIITGALPLKNARERLAGYEAALTEAGIEIDRTLIAEGDFRQETGLRLGKDLLLRNKRPTALFVSNGMMALGVLEAMDEMGLSCPEDLALATFDDLQVANVFRPRLTAVAQPGYQIGFQGAELLLQRIRGELQQEPVHIRLEPEVKIRDSTRSVIPEITRQAPQHRNRTVRTADSDVGIITGGRRWGDTCVKVLEHRIAEALQDQVFWQSLLKHGVRQECADFFMSVHLALQDCPTSPLSHRPAMEEAPLHTSSAMASTATRLELRKEEMVAPREYGFQPVSLRRWWPKRTGRTSLNSFQPETGWQLRLAPAAYNRFQEPRAGHNGERDYAPHAPTR